MRGIASGVVLIGTIFAVFTIAACLIGCFRRSERYRLNVAVLLFCLVAAPFAERLGGAAWPFRLLAAAMTWVSPYLVTRLVLQFRDTSRWLTNASLAVAIGAPILYTVWPDPRPFVVDVLVYAGSATILGVTATLLTQAFGRAYGVIRARLFVAALATWLFAATAVLGALFVAVPSLSTPAWPLVGVFYGATLIGYSFAFSTPRWLRRGWQRAEEARYLTERTHRDPEERGERAAEDLCRAAARSSGSALTLVALTDPADAGRLTVRARSDPALHLVSCSREDPLVLRAWSGAMSGPVAECLPALGDHLRPFGSSVLMAPIVGHREVWGIVAVVQRRGSLFPEDDLTVLGQLARHAATVLDYAHLVTEARARERRLADRRLREVEARLALMLDSIKDYALFAIDDRGTVANWHAGAEHVFGYSMAEIIDQSAAELFEMTPDQLATFLDESRQLGTAHREGPCRRKDGSRFLGITDLRPLEGDLEARGYVVVTHDITDRRALEDQLRQSQKMQAIGQLAGGIAHDFNNMLTAILGYADSLESEIRPTDPRRRQVGEIQKAAERAAGLTRQLLTFSRGQMLQPSVINLTRLVEDLLPMLRRMIGEHIVISGVADDAIAPIVGDRTQVEQILLNLAVNARDAMPGGGQLTIRTSRIWMDAALAAGQALPGPFVLLEVSDTGVGMDRATQARIFEPFFTTKAVGAGTGLGLATVFGIVQRMAGLVRVVSEPGSGSTFRLYFPEVLGHEVSAPPASPADAPRGTETVLLVEDDQPVRAYLTEVLEKQGYRVLAAADQTAALAQVQAHVDPIHLVVTDVVMPGGTGPELVRALAQVRSPLSVLYISGYADAALSRESSPLQAGYFLQKPFSATTLLGKIRQILSPPV